jgi:hypothetical protein
MARAYRLGAIIGFYRSVLSEISRSRPMTFFSEIISPGFALIKYISLDVR